MKADGIGFPARGTGWIKTHTWLLLLLLSYFLTLFQCSCLHCSFPFNFHTFHTVKALYLCCREWDDGEVVDCGSIHIWIPLQAVLGVRLSDLGQGP